MIFHEILKKIRPIELRTNRIVADLAERGCVRIPTGFRPKAQGCEVGRSGSDRAALGHRPTIFTNRNVVAAVLLPPGARGHRHNPVGVGDGLMLFTARAVMKINLKVRALGTILSLLFLCSCVTTHHPTAIASASELPADATINKSAGRGGVLFITLRLENGEELPFDVDTGSGGTLFDKSLEPKLGKRLGTTSISSWGVNTGSGRYATPNLYLGSTRLVMGSDICTYDFKGNSSLAGRPIMGILGMDCLKHYCIQLDFEAGKMRFLNSDNLNTAELGKAYPLTFKGGRPHMNHVSLTGGKGTNSLIDLACFSDGFVEKGTVSGQDSGMVKVPEWVWDGEIYTNLLVGNSGNIIGLRFLARHLVTFDFPKGMMYLKQTSVGPLVDEDLEGAGKFLHDLKENGQLPGFSKDDRGTTATPEPNPNSVTFNYGKSGDSSIYHYTVGRESKESPWKLQKAWRADQNGRTIEEYPVL